ncbi:MAG TPA: molybdopterin molybdotransferase MoeA [Streptosporangiaceae bacterium]|nr:molybdopterin molybdotransferase MoeA [Streptosporangiaceae bacterium]
MTSSDQCSPHRMPERVQPDDQTGPAVISVAVARRHVLAGIVPLAPRRVAIGDASGPVLAETVRAGEAIPRFANSAMDGYAVRAADVADAPVRLRVAGTVAAGDGPKAAPARGEAIRIMTGAPLPPGADAVCMIERVQVQDGGSAVLIEAAVSPGTNVRHPGEDIAAGTEVFSPGTQLRPAHIGVLASLGIQSLLVYPHPTVASWPGVSVGDHDVLKVALEKLGGTTMRSLPVAVKPGKHVAFALLGEQPVPAFGLPGNPVAALVTYELYVRPALRAMAGCQVLNRPRISAIAETDLPRQPGPKLHLVRVTARTGPGGELRVRLSGGQDSHMLRAMAQANALALLPDGDGVRAGGRVGVLLLDTEGLGLDGAITPS